MLSAILWLISVLAYGAILAFLVLKAEDANHRSRSEQTPAVEEDQERRVA